MGKGSGNMGCEEMMQVGTLLERSRVTYQVVDPKGRRLHDEWSLSKPFSDCADEEVGPLISLAAERTGMSIEEVRVIAGAVRLARSCDLSYEQFQDTIVGFFETGKEQMLFDALKSNEADAGQTS